MDTQKFFEDLIDKLEEEFGDDILEFYSIENKSLPEWLINQGYIPKESAIEFVEICPSCKGEGGDWSKKSDIFKVKFTQCVECLGRGLVMRKEK